MQAARPMSIAPENYPTQKLEQDRHIILQTSTHLPSFVGVHGFEMFLKKYPKAQLEVLSEENERWPVDNTPGQNTNNGCCFAIAAAVKF